MNDELIERLAELLEYNHGWNGQPYTVNSALRRIEDVAAIAKRVRFLIGIDPYTGGPAIQIQAALRKAIK